MSHLKGDLNANGTIDNKNEARANIEYNAKDITMLQSELKKLKRRADIDIVTKGNAYASSAKLAEELTDGKQRVYFNNVTKSVVFKNGMKPLTSCLQIVTNDNSIKNVSHVHFENGSTLYGLIDEITALTSEEASHYAPSMNYLNAIIDPSFEVFASNLSELNDKTTDVSYDSESETTTIGHKLVVGGDIDCTWLDNEFAKYSLSSHNHDTVYAGIGHNHDSVYAALGHGHEFADVYKQTTKTIVNANTEEEEEITETKTLQDVLDELETSLKTLINGKANASHTHEFADVYKTITMQGENGTTTTTKTLQQILDEYEQSMNTSISGKANISHTHNATDVIYQAADGNNAAINVKQQLDTIMNKLEIADGNGQSIDILTILFGAGAVAGAAIDGGLFYAFTSLQAEIAALQAQITTNGVLDMTDQALDAFDTVSDASSGLSWFQRFINAISTWFRRICAAFRGYEAITPVAVDPLAGAVVL